jgi:multidrug resistance protein, MATE family
MSRRNRRKRRPKPSVAPGLQKAGGRRLRPDTGKRLHGLLTSLRVNVRRRLGSLVGGREGAASPAGAERTLRSLISLAGPIAAAMLGETALGLVDTKLVGGLGPAALGGVGMAVVLLFLNYAIVFGLMRGVKVRSAYAAGQGRCADALRYAQAGVIFGGIAGLFVWFLTRDVSPVLVWLQVDSSIVPYARDFIAARSWGAPAACALAALIQYRQGIGDSKTPMLVGLGGNLLNASLAYALIYGHFGLPALGVRGAGFGTAITEVCNCTVMLFLLLRQEAASRKDAAASAEPQISLRRAMREVGSLGLPTALHFGFEVAGFTLFTALLGSVGAAQVAAHQIAMNTIRASFLPGVAIAEAASVLVAQALAQRKLDEADRVTRAALLLGAGFMTMCGVVFALFGDGIAGAFSPDAEVVAIARRLLLVAAAFQTFDACNMILRGALRGAKDVRWVAVVGTTVVWCSLPGAALLFGRYLGWGALGGWLGFIVETTIASALMWRRWSRGPFRKAFMGNTPLRREVPAMAAALAG